MTVIDPRPARRWSATYAAWADELPSWLSPDAVAARVPRPVAWGTRRFEFDREYVVFAVGALQDSLEISGANVVTGRVERIHRHPRPLFTHGAEAVSLSDGMVLRARRVIDARGLTRSPARAEQTAYGVVLHRDRWGEAVFMDWRPDNGAPVDAPRSFLYAVPLGADTVLLEETCLAGRPALPIADLRDRLHTRLRCRGIELDGTESIERVRFPVEGARPGTGRFGAAGGFLHPATGYSVAAALAAADAIVARLPTASRATGEPFRPMDEPGRRTTAGGPATRELTDVLARHLSARAVHLMRTAGLRALLALPPADIPVFFDAFFELPPARQRAYLSGRDDLPGTAAAMAALFRALPRRMRRTLVTATIGVPG